MKPWFPLTRPYYLPRFWGEWLCYPYPSRNPCMVYLHEWLIFMVNCTWMRHGLGVGLDRYAWHHEQPDSTRNLPGNLIGLDGGNDLVFLHILPHLATPRAMLRSDEKNPSFIGKIAGKTLWGWMVPPNNQPHIYTLYHVGIYWVYLLLKLGCHRVPEFSLLW